MYLRGDISILVPGIFSEIVAILTYRAGCTVSVIVHYVVVAGPTTITGIMFYCII
jgi:hypothetical protein